MDDRHRLFGVALCDHWCNALVERDVETGVNASCSEATMTPEMHAADRAFNVAMNASEWPVPYNPSGWDECLVTEWSES